MSKPLLGAVLIVKNEQFILPRCLESLKELDQIVVLDTGSTDRTMAVAKKHGAEVFAGELRDPFHFSEARNEALQHVRTKWALSIDADEILKAGSSAALRRELALTTKTAFRLDFRDSAPGSDAQFTSRKIRLFQTGLWGWKGRIHEELALAYETPPGTFDSISGYERYLQKVIGDLTPDVAIEHHPEPAKKGRRSQNLDLLNLAIIEENRSQLLKKMGYELALQGRHKDAIRFIQEYLVKEKENPLEMSETLIHLGQAYAASGSLDDAIGAFSESATVAPDRREPLWQAYLELMKKNRMLDALYYLERVLSIDPSRKPTFWLNLEAVWGTLPHEALDHCKGLINQALGPEKAEDFWASWNAQKGKPPMVAG